jgi:drug/metabolite transporter (DMT)-like permease
MYSRHILSVLVCMIVTGAARSVIVKLFYQFGFEKPFFVTLLYLLGQAISLLVYYAAFTLKSGKQKDGQEEDEDPEMEEGQNDKSNSALAISSFAHVTDGRASFVDQRTQNSVTYLSDAENDGKSAKGSVEEDLDEDNACSTDENPAPLPPKKSSRRKHSGSLHGLTEESKEAIKWVHRIPYYLKPLIPGFFNLCNSAMRWAALVYVPASVAEILMSGLELVLSVAASRIIRKRMISWPRWTGAGVVTLGIVLIGVAGTIGGDDSNDANDANAASKRDRWIGLLLIIGQSIMSVLQDLAEELFMQEAEIPATLLLGMEGLFGLVIGSIIYFPLATQLGEPLSETMDNLNDWRVATFAIGLVLLFLITGIFNIMATAVTSSMTRNVWKNFRTILVWTFGLIIFYSTQNESLGEPWSTPESFIILCGFCVMLSGAYIYYSMK